MSDDWHTIETAPAGELVETMIRDEHGDRNITMLKREGRLWWLRDGDLYVYYTPTHWRRVPQGTRPVGQTRGSSNG